MFHICSPRSFLLFCRINLLLNPSDANPHNQTPRTSLSRGHGMGSSVGGDCVLVLANREPNEVPSDLVWANQRWAKSPIDNSVRVPGPCADSTLRATGRQGHGTCRGNRQLEADFIGLTSSDDLKAICEKGLTVTFNHIFKMRRRCGVECTPLPLALLSVSGRHCCFDSFRWQRERWRRGRGVFAIHPGRKWECEGVS